MMQWEKITQDKMIQDKGSKGRQQKRGGVWGGKYIEHQMTWAATSRDNEGDGRRYKSDRNIK